MSSTGGGLGQRGNGLSAQADRRPHPWNPIGQAFALLLISCGGAPFTVAENDAGVGIDTTQDAAFASPAPDVGAPLVVEDAFVPDAFTNDAASIVDAHDTHDANTCDGPTVGWWCGSSVATGYAPKAFCEQFSTTIGPEQIAGVTPVSCANWCDFTCACLEHANICQTGIKSCVQHADRTIEIDCVGAT